MMNYQKLLCAYMLNVLRDDHIVGLRCAGDMEDGQLTDDEHAELLRIKDSLLDEANLGWTRDA